MTDAKPAEGAKPKITKDMPIGKIVSEHPETFEVFMKYNMHCVGCAAARFENLAQGCEAHGFHCCGLGRCHTRKKQRDL